MDQQTESLSPHVDATQVKRVSRNMRTLLIWILFFCAYNIVIYYALFKKFSYYLSISNLFIIAILVVGFVISRRLSNPAVISHRTLNVWCQSLCLALGIGLGINTYFVYAFLPIENSAVGPFRLIMLSIVPVSIIYIIALSYLSQRLRYFLLIFIPSTLPFILANVFYPDRYPLFINIIINAWLLIIFIAAILSSKLYQRLSLLDNNNLRLAHQSQILSQYTDELQIKLRAQIEQSNEIRKKLQYNNELLEEKVKQRSYEIKRINERLGSQQINLSLAHETAGISSWSWDIKKREIEVSTAMLESEFDFFNNQKADIELIVHPDDLDVYKYRLRQHLRGKSERFEANYRIKRNQEWFWIQDIGKIVSRDALTNHPLKMVGIFRDIHHEKKAQEQLRLAAKVFDHVVEGIFVLDQRFCYVNVNPFFEELVGSTHQELFGRYLFDLTVSHRAEIIRLHNTIQQQILLTGYYESEVQLDLVNGKKLSLLVKINAIMDDQNKIINYIGISTDLTYRKKQEQRVLYLENYDLLTALPNRFYFNLKLHHFAHSNISLKHFSIIRVNIDRFRLFNEILNNNAGDVLLKMVARRLESCCSSAQLIAYLNNDDFAIIYNMPNQTISIHQLAQTILQEFQQPFQILGQEQNVSISIGVATYLEHDRQLDNVMSHAELALADAKRLGGNTICFYNKETTALLDDSIMLKHDLQHAIKKQQLTVHYQPQVCAKTSKILGFEALVRWQHPQRGLISPELFIPLAEATSLISEIGQFVIFESCKQLQIWREQGFDNIRVSVNVVAQQIQRGQLLIDLDTAMSMYKIKGEQLELELTESSLLDRTEDVLALMDQIKQRNILISLDDFGTGYSSLAYLSQYPINTLKIDRAFISRIGTARDAAIVDAIIAMGKAMGMVLIAEGVETQEQVDYLKSQECNLLQGYYFSKPLSALESTAYLNQYSSSLSASS